MLLTLVLATAAVTGIPIYSCDRDAGGSQHSDCELAIAAWKAGWKPNLPEKSLALARKRVKERSDLNLLARYPTQNAYWKSRHADLEPLMASLSITNKRILLLEAEKVPLENEVEFYPHGPLPAKLMSAVTENAASLGPLRRIAAVQQARIAQANAFYDSKLVHLMHLWGCTAYRSQIVAKPRLEPGPGPMLQHLVVVIGQDDAGGVSPGTCGLPGSPPA